ncbi:phage tail protein [Enterobacter cloacae]|uniref:phage tail protein n=1 Tax=Enterobacter cloacae TaxID=550 RepID=UPI000FEB6D0B|nr:phage tail protein [Enterobacter cloacae]ELV2844216.1 phage tail protein [Enterobacter cloacae]RWT27591.1 chemotaxis protein [Enterobacter cloacae]UER84165.1 phage tail protein [Enterobacter cloacae]
MYAVLGEIEFEVVAYWDAFETTLGVDYASHARIEGKPGVQFIGDKLEKITLQFSFHSQFCQPSTEFNRLRTAMTAHQAMALVFGNGDYRGWFVITDLSASHQHTDPSGNVIAQSGSLTLQEYTGDPKDPLLPPAITTQEPNIDEMLDDFPELSDAWFDDLMSAAEDGMRDAKEMMDDMADTIDDIKKKVAQAQELVKEAKALKKKCSDIIDSLKKTIDSVEALLRQPLDLQTLAGLPKALAAKIQALIGSLPGIRECARDASTLIEQAESLFNVITSSVAEASYDSAALLVNQGRSTMQKSASEVSQLAAADITRSL